MDPEIWDLVKSTTGPLGTLLVLGFGWLQRMLGQIRSELKTKASAASVQQLQVRVAVLERSVGVPQHVAMAPTPVEGVPL